MKKTVILAIASVAALSSAALAAPMNKAGAIQSMDNTKHELVLATGDTFELAKGVKVDKLKVGEKVNVTYEVKDGKNIASKVHLAK